MTRIDLGEAALTGWRRKVATGVSGPVSRHAPVQQGTVEQVIGGLFFLLSAIYVVRVVSKLARRR